MHFICYLRLSFNLLVYIILIESTIGESNAILSANSSLNSKIGVKTNQINESKDEDLLILSSWQTLKYWTSNSRLHSSNVIQNFEVFHSNVTKTGKITAIDFYTNQTNCQNVLIWCELMSQTIYSSLIRIKDEKLYLMESKKLIQTNFGSHIRLAVDITNKSIYLSSFDFSRIDVFEMETKSLTTFLANVSHPVDIAVDNKRHILFWIENWSCISQTFINNINIVRMCSINARALALDSLNSELFWSDSLGRIFRRKYFESKAQMLFAAKKMNQNQALHVTPGAIYISDLFKLTSINRSALTDKVVLIESPGILVFKSISRKDWCESIEAEEPKPQIEYNLNNESNVITLSPMNRSLIFDYKNNSEQNSMETNWFGAHNNSIYFIGLSILIVFAFILLLSIGFKKFYKKNNLMRNPIKRISGRNTKRFLLSDKNKLLTNGKNANKSVCIEDLGSFSNNGYLDPKIFCNNCPIRQTCSSCDDKDECLERGICLTTYKLLT